MSEKDSPTPVDLLRLCAAAVPNPWYPKAYARSSGVNRDSLDSPLNDLRLAGLVRLTDWEREVGQGYVLTPFGQEVVQNPQLLAQLAKGNKPRLEEALEEEEEPARQAGMTTFERGEVVRGALLLPGKPATTPILIGVNVVAFVATVIVALVDHADFGTFLSRGNAHVVHEAGGLMASDLVRGDWWRLLTCCFLHFGLFHLVMNMYSLYLQGKMLEPLWSPARFLLLYLLSGVGGSTAAMLFNPGSPDVQPVVAGASGAIWGLMCSAIAWVGLNREFIPTPVLRDWLRGWAVVVMLNVAVSFVPGVSAAAHFGGGAVGVLVGTLLHFQRFAGPGTLRSVLTAVLALLPVVFVMALGAAMESGDRWKKIVDVEQRRQRDQAMRIFVEGPAPLVEGAGNDLRALDDGTAALLNQPKARRDAGEVAAAREQAEGVARACQKALDGLGDVPYAVEAAEKLRLAGREYMAAAKHLAEAVGRALDPERPEGDPSVEQFRKFRKDVTDARLKWRETIRRG